MVFSLVTCFGLEIDHNQVTYTIISTQVKMQYALLFLVCLWDPTTNQ